MIVSQTLPLPGIKNYWSRKIYNETQELTAKFARMYSIANSYLFVPAFFLVNFLFSLYLYFFYDVPSAELPLPYKTL